MSLPRLVKLGPRTPQNCSVKLPHPRKLHREKVLNRQQLIGALFDAFVTSRVDHCNSVLHRVSVASVPASTERAQRRSSNHTA